MVIRSTFVVIVVAGLTLMPAWAPAQRIGVTTGPAIPLGSLGEHRDVGARVEAVLSSRRGLFRAGVAGTYIGGSDESEAGAWLAGDWRSTSLSVSVLPPISSPDPVVIRGVLGGSLHWLSIRGASNPSDGPSGGLQLGGVLERRWTGGTGSLEVAWNIVLSDFGAEKATPAVFLPITIGWRF